MYFYPVLSDFFLCSGIVMATRKARKGKSSCRRSSRELRGGRILGNAKEKGEESSHRVDMLKHGTEN